MNIQSVEQLLITNAVGSKIIWHDRIDSTNNIMRSAQAHLPEGAVIGADEQTAGHGRFQRPWVSQPGENLLFTVLLRPTIAEEHLPLLNFLASLAVANAVRAYPGVHAVLRWPNDVFVKHRKLCGILSERSGDAVLIGIGLNVNQRTFPADVPNATSLAIESGVPVERDRLLHILLRELDDQYTRVQRSGFGKVMNDWRALCDMPGMPVTVQQSGTPLIGTVKAIDDSGALIVTDEAGIDHLCYAGDTSLHA